MIEKALLVTRVQTIKNAAATIPNGTVLSNQVVNYTTLAASHRLILHTSVTIGYSAPWRRVHELLLDAARGTEHVVAAPAPFVLQTELGTTSTCNPKKIREEPSGLTTGSNAPKASPQYRSSNSMRVE